MTQRDIRFLPLTLVNGLLNFVELFLALATFIETEYVAKANLWLFALLPVG